MASGGSSAASASHVAARLRRAFGGEGVGHLQEVHPVQELRPVLLRHAEDLAKGEERQLRREHRHQVALAERRHGVEQAGDLRLHLALQPAQVGGVK
ncbi:hypothetical protein [Phenylobacterium sp. J367]|uniref:hypothetical protein n=1 Tax=Phenylobacterium sp. J367 TaxID=2898435 RepID=UPI0021512942|nr:hypothetical protein [Phenylobacterium sp. J367]MCR5877755.1 hypothetical protein [Phenylobacterium sp. J367]